MLDLIVAAYSPAQDAWHVETLRQHVGRNAKCLTEGALAGADFCAVFVADSEEAAHAEIARSRSRLSREGVKRA